MIYGAGMPMPTNAATNELDGHEGWLFRRGSGVHADFRGALIVTSAIAIGVIC